MLNAIIIDDEQRFIDVIKDYLSRIDAVQLTGEAKSVVEGVALIKEVQPDLIFLDIELPDGISFEILSQFPNKNFQVIFTTGHNEYAIKAIKHSAIDYLLKPIPENDFVSAVHKAINLHGNKVNAQKLELMLSNLSNNEFSKIAIPSMDGFEFIDKKQIVCCEADVSYTTFHLADNQKIVSTNNIKKIEDVLSEKNFFRLHKSFIVNIKHIRKVFKTDGGSVLMSNNVTIPIARRRKDEFMKLLSL